MLPMRGIKAAYHVAEVLPPVYPGVDARESENPLDDPPTLPWINPATKEIM